MMNSKEEELVFCCSLYSRWDKTSSSWKTETGDCATSLSLLTNQSSKNKQEDSDKPEYVLLVVLSGQDVLQRIRYIFTRQEFLGNITFILLQLVAHCRPRDACGRPRKPPLHVRGRRQVQTGAGEEYGRRETVRHYQELRVCDRKTFHLLNIFYLLH